jgi:subtilase family serine protease
VACLSGGVTAAAQPLPTASSVRLGANIELPAHARFVKPVPASRSFDLTIQLKSRDPRGLAAFVRGVSTPGSAGYRHYLTVAEFARRFGATPAAMGTAAAAFRRAGLRAGPPTADALSLPVAGTASQIDHALGTAIDVVRLAGGATGFASRTAPAVPAAAAPYVQGVFGLDDLDSITRADAVDRQPAGGAVHTQTARRPAASAAAAPQPCAAAISTATTTFAGSSGNLAYRSGYTADKLAAVYGFTGLYGAGDEGAGQTVALDEEKPYLESDVQAFQQCYGTDASVRNVIVGAGVGTTSTDDTPALGIEEVTALAPKAKVLVYMGTDQVAIFTKMVSDDVAQVLSTSWTTCEAAGASRSKSYETLFEEAAAQGQSVFAASGDHGSQCGSALATALPASSPDVTAVGGTTLYAVGPGGAEPYAAGRTPVAAVWNNGIVSSSPTGTGGGTSALYPMPAYQSDAASALGVINSESGGSCGATDCREVPDVSADGDGGSGYTVYADGAWKVLGGTSAATPVWAAFAALANASATCHGTSVGFVNPSLYRLANGSSATSLLSDVVNASPRTGAANNDAAGTNGGHYAVRAGYDMATGLGSMHGSALAGALCKLRRAQLPGKPTAHKAHVSGTAAGHPRLSVIVDAGRRAPAVRAITLTVPSQLKLAAALKKLKRGVTVKRGHKRERVTVRRKGRRLRLVVSPAARSVTVTIAGPAITVGRAFRTKVRRHKVKRLHVPLTVTDASSKPTVLHLTFTL